MLFPVTAFIIFQSTPSLWEVLPVVVNYCRRVAGEQRRALGEESFYWGSTSSSASLSAASQHPDFYPNSSNVSPEGDAEQTRTRNFSTGKIQRTHLKNINAGWKSTHVKGCSLKIHRGGRDRRLNREEPERTALPDKPPAYRPSATDPNPSSASWPP